MTLFPLWFADIGDDTHRDTRGGGASSADPRDRAPSTSRRPALALPPDFVERVRARDHDAIATLVQVAFTPLVRFAYGFVRSVDVAEDVVQEVFVRLWAQGPSWTPHTGVTAYLYGAVRNQALNAIRHQAADTRRRDAIGAVAHDGDTVAGIPLADPSPEQLALWNELMDAFERTLDALTERQRTAVLLRYEQGCTVPEVAVVLGIAPKAAEKLLSRALRELRSRLEDFAR